MNTLEGSILHITSPGNYTCDIIRHNGYYPAWFNCIYLVHNKRTGVNYWAKDIGCYNRTLKIEHPTNEDNNEITNPWDKNINKFIRLDQIDKDYIIYIATVILTRIPNSYKIENDRIKWNDFCKQIEEEEREERKYSITRVSNIFELRQYIATFL